MPEVFEIPKFRYCLSCNMKYGSSWEDSKCLCGKKLVSEDRKKKEAIAKAKDNNG